MNLKSEKNVAEILFAVSIFIRYGMSPKTVLFVPFAFILAECAFADLETRAIPGRMLKAGLLYRLLTVPLAGNIAAELAGIVPGAAVMFIILFPASVLYEQARKRRSIGGGDIKLFVLAGAYLGVWSGLISLFAACLLGLAFSLVSTDKGSAFPWGPAIAIGVVAAMTVV